MPLVVEGATIYTQNSGAVNYLYWSSHGHTGSFYTMRKDDGTTQTDEFYFENPFPFGATIGGYRGLVGVFSSGGATNITGSINRASGGVVTASLCSQSQSVPDGVLTYVAFTCSASVNPGDDLTFSFSATSQATQEVIFVETDTSDTNWRLVKPLIEIRDTGPFSNATGTPQIGGIPYSPVIQDIGIATTTAAAFCQQNNATSTGFLTDVTNGFGTAICYSFAFLFVPSQNALSQFSALASTTQSKIPFSYFFGLKDIYTSLTASSSVNLPTYSIDLPAFGTTTPLGNILPDNITFLSTSTIDTYYPTATREAFLFLGSSAIWLGLGFILYRRVVPHHTIENKT